MKCPYCAEEIQPEALKCKHCGEWLDKSRAPAIRALDYQRPKPNYSSYRVYEYTVRMPNSKLVRKRILAINPEQARSEALRSLIGGYEFYEPKGISVLPTGRLSCPNCGSAYTNCNRDIGLFLVILIIFTFGIALLLIPLMPFNCICNACGNKWKS